jgi:CrcB protein
VTALLVALGAAVGAPLRYLVDRAISTRVDSVLPWGTFAVNVTGSFLLGLLAGAALSTPVLALVGTGFCGAFTTYSTFGYETVRLMRDSAHLAAALNAVGSVLAGVAAAFLGAALASLTVGG